MKCLLFQYTHKKCKCFKRWCTVTTTLFLLYERKALRKERAFISRVKSLIGQIPDSRLYYVISYLQGAAVPDETPNADTLEAFAEMENGGGHRFSGTTEQLFTELMED